MIHNRSRKNLATGLIYQFVSIAAGLILPYLFITNFGSETNGLLSSIGQLFVYLGLLEAGVGTASLQALYKPVAEDDRDGISAILAATNRYYIKTGVYYTASILLLAVIYPFLVDSALSASTIRLVILLQGAGQVVGYLTKAKYTILLQSEGKNYLLNLLMTAELVLRNVGKIAAIALGYGVVAVQIAQFFTLCTEALVIVLYIRRRYPWLDLKHKPNFGAISQKSSVLVQAIAWIVFNHTDILVLTVVTRNLALVSVYSVYHLIFEAIQNVTNMVRVSYHYKIGYYAQRSKEELTKYYSRYSITMIAFSCLCFGTTYLLSTPFVHLYTEKATDADYMMRWLPELFFAFKMLYCFRAIIRQPIEAGGHFRATQKIAIIEASTNMLVSLILVFCFSIYGVLIGTLAALIYSTIAYSLYVTRHVVTKEYKLILKLQLIHLLPISVTLFVGSSRIIQTDNYLQLFINAIIVFLLNAVFYCLSVFGQMALFNYKLVPRKNCSHDEF